MINQYINEDEKSIYDYGELARDACGKHGR